MTKWGQSDHKYVRSGRRRQEADIQRRRSGVEAAGKTAGQPADPVEERSKAGDSDEEPEGPFVVAEVDQVEPGPELELANDVLAQNPLGFGVLCGTYRLGCHFTPPHGAETNEPGVAIQSGQRVIDMATSSALQIS